MPRWSGRHLVVVRDSYLITRQVTTYRLSLGLYIFKSIGGVTYVIQIGTAVAFTPAISEGLESEQNQSSTNMYNGAPTAVILMIRVIYEGEQTDRFRVPGPRSLIVSRY